MQMRSNSIEIGLISQISYGKQWNFQASHDRTQLQILLNVFNLLITDGAFVDALAKPRFHGIQKAQEYDTTLQPPEQVSSRALFAQKQLYPLQNQGYLLIFGANVHHSANDVG